MRVYRQGDSIANLENGCVMALGSFDALHIAHRQLICYAARYGRAHKIPSGVFLFERRPENLLFPLRDNRSLYSSEERVRILSEMGVDFVYFASFDESMRRKSAREFAAMLKERFHVSRLSVGFHYRFGYRGEGDARLLASLGEELGFGVEVTPPVTYGGELVSSTRVRALVEAGEVAKAAQLLGRPYSVSGEVCSDRGVGRQMRLPTANLMIKEPLVELAHGVYATMAHVGGMTYPSVTNVGVRPTFGLDRLAIEAHMLDFDGNLYGKRVRLEFIARLRGEIRFASKEALMGQIAKDIDRTRILLCGKWTHGTRPDEID